MTREEKESLLREAVDILIKLDNHLMTSRDNAEFSQWVEDLIDNYCEERETGWTPVSKGLPEYTGDYTVTVGINYEGEGMHTEVRTALYNVVFKTWQVYESDKAIIGDVIAWCDVQEPYKAD